VYPFDGGQAFRAKVEGLVVHAYCGVTDEERALPQALRIELDYLYEAETGDELAGIVNYEAIIEGVAGVLEKEEFGLPEMGVRRVGEHVLSGFPAVREVTVRVTKLRMPVARTVSRVSVEATFRW
jgi:7,8-dihydroneopterin aldolase/epimerase/oxygenase